MRRRWIGLLAVLGVLAHAGALVAHHVVMTNAHLQHQALVSDLRQICHTDTAGTSQTANLPDIPRPADSQNTCPVCSGLASLFAFAAPEAAVVLLRIEQPIPRGIVVASLPEQPRSLHPPARGPPTLL